MVGNPNSRNCLLLIWIPQNLAPVCTYLKSEISTSLLSLLQVFFSSNSSHSILWWETLLYNYAMNIIYSWVFNFISSNKVDVICFYLEQSTALLTTGKKLLFSMATLLEPVGVSVQCHFKEPLEQWMRDSALIPLPALFNLKCFWERETPLSLSCANTPLHTDTRSVVNRVGKLVVSGILSTWIQQAKQDWGESMAVPQILKEKATVSAVHRNERSRDLVWWIPTPYY